MAAAVPSATDSSESLMRSSHLRELIGGASSDLGYPESSQLLLQFLQLCPKLTLALLAQLMRLELGCTTTSTSVRTSCKAYVIRAPGIVTTAAYIEWPKQCYAFFSSNVDGVRMARDKEGP